jgi:class 3 adenylate cyclase
MPEGIEQRRVVTILFADITSSTTLAESMDPEDVRSLLAAFFTTMARQIHRHGGTVEKYIGDAVMAVFGLPLAHEDDPLRAVRAALDMLAALRQFNAGRLTADPTVPEIRMRIGINTGEVVAASGAAEGRDFLITGDPVNVAARLQQAAEPGTIIVGPRTVRSTSGAIVYRERDPIQIRGRAHPVRVWEAVAQADQSVALMPLPRGVDRQPTPLVGRDDELALLDSLYARTADERHAHLITIIGAPGVGKTRLAREFFQRTLESKPSTARLHVLEGRCPPYGEGITYWPLAEMLRTLCGFSPLDPARQARARVLSTVRDILQAAGREDDPVLLAAYLGHTIGIETPERRQTLLPSDSRQQQEGMWRAWRTLFEALAATAPLLLLVDDIHRADEALLDLLEYVVARAGRSPLLLICTSRPELLERRPEWGGGRSNFVTIGLDTLPRDQAEQLISELLVSTTPESLRMSILERAEGNPFYVEEIVRMLVDRGLLVRDEDALSRWRIAPRKEESDEVRHPAIPDTVQGVLTARLDLLPDEERDVLQHAAVIGRMFWASALRSLHPQYTAEKVRAILDTLHARNLIREIQRPNVTVAPAGEPFYVFNHTLTREVTYAAIPRARRAHEHAEVARWLEALAVGREAEVADMLARHYLQYYVQGNLARSRDEVLRRAVASKAIYHLILAGDQAIQRHGAMLADRHFTNALAILAEDLFAPDLPRRIRVLMKRGDVRWMRMRADDAWRDYREALRLWAVYSDLALVSAQGESVRRLRSTCWRSVLNRCPRICDQRHCRSTGAPAECGSTASSCSFLRARAASFSSRHAMRMCANSSPRGWI